MEYKKIRNTVYIKVDKGENIVQTILSVCKKREYSRLDIFRESALAALLHFHLYPGKKGFYRSHYFRND